MHFVIGDKDDCLLIITDSYDPLLLNCIAAPGFCKLLKLRMTYYYYYYYYR